MARPPHNPCPSRLHLLLAFLVTTIVSAGTSPESDLYALSKLKSSLLSRSAPNSPLLVDWDIASPSSSGASSPGPARHYCNFSGITCDTSSRVVAINLTEVPFHDGVLPTEISLLDALTNLTVAACSLTGLIPATLSSMPLLRHLNLSNNNLAGTFPSPKRRHHVDNTAPVPPYFPSLEVLDVYNNNLLGTLPPFGRSQARLRYLHVGGNVFEGSIPEAYGDMEALEYLGLNGNSLSGRVPPSLSRLKRLRQMYLGYYNLFDGGIPMEFGELEALVILDMSRCNLTGAIPAELGSLTQLDTLYLSDNKLSGEIPVELGNLKNLTILDISHNDLTGQIPASLTGLTKLKQLLLFKNSLQGVIPELLGELAELEDLKIWSNNLSGKLPANLGKNGRLLYLDFSHNQLTGAIPPHLSSCKTLTRLYLNNNFLNGSIPAQYCDSLIALHLSGNQFTGGIPEEIATLKVLRRLNLSRNSISGDLPMEILRMPSLTMLDVSYNNLTGRLSLPKHKMFNEVNFEGNPGLCVERITAASCHSMSQRSRRSKTRTLLFWLVPTTSAFVFVVLVGMCLGLRGRCRAWREGAKRRRPVAWKMIRFQKLDLEMDDVLGCLREENVIGRGGAGTVYRCVTRSGTEVAVKRLPGPGRRDHGFRAEVTTLGGIRHRNVVRLLGFASSAEGNLLLYEYMPMGSLGGVLHGDGGGVLLGWVARHRVATEAARALCYLHHECSPRILHRDIKSNNILLDAAMEAHVADFGLARFLTRGVSCSGSTRAVAAERGAQAHRHDGSPRRC